MKPNKLPLNLNSNITFQMNIMNSTKLSSQKSCTWLCFKKQSALLFLKKIRNLTNSYPVIYSLWYLKRFHQSLFLRYEKQARRHIFVLTFASTGSLVVLKCNDSSTFLHILYHMYPAIKREENPVTGIRSEKPTFT